LYDRVSAAWQLQWAVADLDRRDPGWHFEDIEAQRKPLPDDQNSALRVLEARDLLPDRWPPARTPPDPANPGVEPVSLGEPALQRSPEERLNPEETEELREGLEDVETALAAARRLTDYPSGRYPVPWSQDFVSTPLPGREITSVGYLLQLDAVLRAQ